MYWGEVGNPGGDDGVGDALPVGGGDGLPVDGGGDVLPVDGGGDGLPVDGGGDGLPVDGGGDGLRVDGGGDVLPVDGGAYGLAEVGKPGEVDDGVALFWI